MFKIDKEKCVGCGACVEVCPVHAISIVGGKAKINANKCVDCGRCAQVCPQGALHPGTQQQNSSLNQGRIFPFPGFRMGRSRGLGRSMGRGLGRGPHDGRGRGRSRRNRRR